MKTQEGIDDLASLEYAVVDFETTTDEDNNIKVIEAGVVQIDQLTISKQFSSLVNPQCYVKYIDQTVSGLKDSDLEGKPTIDKVFSEFSNYIKNRIIISHSKYDIKIIDSLSKGFGIDNPYTNSIDTLAIAKKLLDLDSYSLKNIKRLQGIHTITHRALDDCIATAQMYLSFVKLLKERHNIKSLSKLNAFLEGRDPHQTALF